MKFSSFTYLVTLVFSERLFCNSFICRKSERICMAVQATTIETVTVVRPLKVNSLYFQYSYTNSCNGD
ncbi:unnamed protein product [Brugia timori]|uniref:Secreted protein n=1 Tax=Brugia timori TaxID=42155 RepID=A0A0R3QK21_9BILA|nr:unnamed protein product [Brugia timori]